MNYDHHNRSLWDAITKNKYLQKKNLNQTFTKAVNISISQGLTMLQLKKISVLGRNTY